MLYRLLPLFFIALSVLSGCSQSYLGAPYPAGAQLSNNYPWYWEPSCECWLNATHQQATPSAVVGTPVTAPCGAGNCASPISASVFPSAQPALIPCSTNNPCQTTAKPRLPLVQTNTQTGTPLPPVSVATPAVATTTSAPSYWDPNCNCWVTARYMNTPSANPDSALSAANEAKIMAAQALKASGDTDEKINRMYQRLIQK